MFNKNKKGPCFFCKYKIFVILLNYIPMTYKLIYKDKNIFWILLTGKILILQHWKGNKIAPRIQQSADFIYLNLEMNTN